MSLRSIAVAVLALAVTAALVVYAFWDVDFAALGALLAKGDYRVLLPYEILLAGYLLATALRWRLILRPLGQFRTVQVIPAMMIGFGGNNLLPAHMGEILRAVVFGLRFGCSRGAVLATLVIERLLDVFAILLLYAGAALAIRSMPESMASAVWSSATVLGVAALGILAFLRYQERFAAIWERLSRPLPERLATLGTRLLRGAESGMAALRSPWAVAAMIAHSLWKWLCAAGMVWLSLWAFGATIEPALALVVVAVAAVAVTLPSVPGFFGVMQAAFVFALLPFGISREVALAASVFFLLAQWVPVTLAGLLFFFTTGLDARRVKQEVEGV